MSNTNEIEIKANTSGSERIDKFLATRTQFSRSQIQKLLESQSVYVNNSICKKNYKVKNGDIVKIIIKEKEKVSIIPIDHPLDILFEDDHLAIIDKPPGIPVHHSEKDEVSDLTIVNILVHRFGLDNLSNFEGDERPGIVHRLDRDTSGVMLICKNNKIHESIKEMLMKRDGIEKRYYALVVGNMKDSSGLIDSRITRLKGNKMITTNDPNVGKDALTLYKVKARFKDESNNQFYTLIDVKIMTGRTHQIRVHLSSIGYPIIGDKIYGNKLAKTLSKDLLLHSCLIQFNHPITSKNISIRSEYPERFNLFMKPLNQIE